jgi:AraC-like DNA-binding protein
VPNPKEDLSSVLYGEHEAHECISWHMHSSAYAAVVLDGGYREAGDSGRFEVECGQVLFHGRFEGHWDEIGPRRSSVLNIPLAQAFENKLCNFGDLDALIRLADRDIAAAVELLLASARPITAARADWPDLLASALRGDPSLEIGRWAACHNLDPATVSRGFGRAFGVSPAHYRRRQRSLAAWKAISHSKESLAGVAAACGFTDQAHMTHDLRWLTGTTPAAWRKHNVKPLQDR